MVPHVLTLDLLISLSNTTSNSKGATAFPCLKPLSTLNADNKSLPIFNLAYISLLEMLHKLTNILAGNLVYMLPENPQIVDIHLHSVPNIFRLFVS